MLHIQTSNKPIKFFSISKNNKKYLHSTNKSPAVIGLVMCIQRLFTLNRKPTSSLFKFKTHHQATKPLKKSHVQIKQDKRYYY